MEPLRTTLLSDGSSDRALLRFIDHLLDSHPLTEDRGFASSWADLRHPAPPGTTLATRILAALELEPCDLLFVHRDAEGMSWEDRLREIRNARPEAPLALVPIVPVRMTEAWLLVDEAAIREAAGNPSGTIPLNLPPVERLEALKDPKATLERALLTASEKSGRRLAQLRRTLGERKQRVAGLIGDLSRLDALPAFARFRRQTRQALDAMATTSREKTTL